MAELSSETVKATVDALLDMVMDADDWQLDAACAELWPGGPDEWCHRKIARTERRSHREEVLRVLLVELGRECQRRANTQGLLVT